MSDGYIRLEDGHVSLGGQLVPGGAGIHGDQRNGDV